MNLNANCTHAVKSLQHFVTPAKVEVQSRSYWIPAPRLRGDKL